MTDKTYFPSARRRIAGRLFFLIFPFVLSLPVNAQIKSAYTDITFEKCKLLESKATGGTMDLVECEGVDGYKLQIADSFMRGSVNVISPENEKFELNIWSYFPDASTIGDTAEWRMKGKIPLAVIIPITAYKAVITSNRSSVYLIVVKISKTSACVTDVVKAAGNQRLKARKLADAASKSSCKKPDFG